MEELISIIIPTYNRAHLICETLDSIVNQSYTNWECIIVDDGSTDNTTQILTGYCKEDKRFQYHKRPINRVKGANACRNFGYELSKGKYIKWFDSDDIMKPKFLETQHNFLNKNPEFDMCSCFLEVFNEKTREIDINVTEKYFTPKVTQSTNPCYSLLIGDLFFPTNGPLWRKSFLSNKELFDELIFKSQEADFNFRIFINTPKYFYDTNAYYLVRRNHYNNIDGGFVFTDKMKNSIFRYYQNALNLIILTKDFRFNFLKNKMINYCLYRQLNIYTELCSKEKRNTSYIKFQEKKLLKNVKFSTLSTVKKVSTLLGLKTLKFFKKGFVLVNHKELNI